MRSGLQKPTLQERSHMGYSMPAIEDKTTEASREFWNHVVVIAKQAREGMLPQLPSLFLEPAEAPQGQQIKVLLKTGTRIVLVGVIFENGTPGIYDFCTNRYIQRDDWDGIIGWMPLPE